MRSWKLLYRVVDGHKIFAERSTGRLAIADDSGLIPELTEDGLLWVDMDRDIRLDAVGSRICGRLPLVDEKGRESHTPTTIKLALWLAAREGRPVVFTQESDVYRLEIQP
jgi:hypothetical protein